MNSTIHLITRLLLTYCLLWGTFIHTYPQNRNADPGSTYPTPDRLFHIARSLNRNLVCYNANQTNGKLDTKEPINVYWLNREKEPGKTNGLSFIQKKMAYGYKVVSQTEQTCTITLTAYPERELTVCWEKDHFVCHIKINDRQAILQSLYVKASPNNPLHVEYVELQGITADTGVPVTERISK
ncbi:DUF4833 domain-containing protein [Parabacteroides massiliensis]|uniref:DUF4833 domain-containing protein n=1 Tax=Parabacteroides massiliensis TaxID=1750560 RepID=UPI00096A42DB|nr:DUF4833 domain-containing protein [Parabacteroides massiliensis]